MASDSSVSNKVKILNAIRATSGITRVELSKESKLTLPSVNSIVRKLEKVNLVKEAGKAASTGGKPASVVAFDGSHYHVLGIDIGTTHLTFSVVDLEGRIIYKELVGTPKDDADIVNDIVEISRKIVGQFTTAHHRLLGIGVGAAGIVDISTGNILLSPNMPYFTTNIVEALKQAIPDLPIKIQNITKCMALAELNFDNQSDAQSFVCINLGHGIGSATVLQGQLYEGSFRGLSEMGHTVIKPHGPLCSCGNHGCLEAVSSSRAIIRDVKAALDDGAQSSLKRDEELDGKKIFEAAIAGDSLASKVTQEDLYYLGVSIGNVINFIDPEEIILEGGMTNSADYLLGILAPVVKDNQLSPSNSPRLRISRLGDDAGVIGAACLIMNRVFNTGDVDMID
ncbi:ROK family transcriptional regulator [Lacticaseibacillus hegangensis]|uniref:ROK family transcriptional regulator n=1 Tax=Lacticaseibacillus hegangensis TaxID=2486010 RepID=A0ABW4D0Q3_9LACO|nr:ROK family transcriptional regulator [Lacticaseibacillus hegangensis]